MRSRSNLPNEDQFMLGSIKRPHSCIGLAPNADVLELIIHPATRRKHFVNMAPINTDVVNRTIQRMRGCFRKARIKEVRVLGRTHFPGCHCKTAVTKSTMPSNIAFDLHVVRRICEHKLGFLALEQPAITGWVASVPTDQPVRPEQPYVTALCYRGSTGHFGNDIFRLKRAIQLFGGFPEHQIDLGGGKARELDLEIRINERLKLDCQRLAIPSGLFREAIVRKDVRALFRFGQVTDSQCWNLLHAKQAGGRHPAMTGYDLPLLIDQDGIGEPETLQ